MKYEVVISIVYDLGDTIEEAQIAADSLLATLKEDGIAVTLIQIREIIEAPPTIN